MQLLNKQKGPEHLIVFITSDADICSKMKQLQRQNCMIVVVYFKPNCSTVPDSISDTADEAYWWLSFLRQGLQMPRLRIRHHNQLSSAVARDHTYEQPTSPKPKVVQESHVLSSDEIDSSNSNESHEQSVESEDELGELPMHTEDNTLMSAVASWVKDVEREQQLQPMLEQHPVSVLSGSAQPVPVIPEACQYPKHPKKMNKYGFDHKENRPHLGQNCYQGAPQQQTHGRSQQAAIKVLLGSITLDHEGWTKLEELLQNILHVGFRHRQDVINLAAQVSLYKLLLSCITCPISSM